VINRSARESHRVTLRYVQRATGVRVQSN